MPDIDKVIKGLMQCMMSSNREEFETQCEDCPYYNPEVTVDECMEPLRQDAITLLKDGRWKTMHNMEKVISHLNDCMEASRRDNTWVFVRKDIVEDALALLKEQEARPIDYTDNPYTGLPVAHCPKCGKFARQFHTGDEEETHYCPWCGQAVKWE